ncbi:MAG: YHS domain-containing protein [Acidimicrobiales bacterium]|nr:YHS domain-containing protein [Acidimicrobiales bacterium]
MDLDRAVEGWGVLERAVELARRGEPFVLATVVWREGPSSGQHGSRAIYTAAGEMYGWIGGACAEPVFKREAAKTMLAGEPRLLALGASERFGDLPQATTAVEMSCQSEGALQIYLEPVMSMPHLVIVGDSPMTETLADQAAHLDWNVERVAGPDFSEGLLSAHSIVVVATQGHGDEDILLAALKATPAYIGVVASAKRGETIRSFLATQSIDSAQLDAMRIPAGLDLGSTTHKEMAVAILAELVQKRAAGEFHGTVEIAAPQPETAVDPICGMTVDAVSTSHPLEIGDETYYFCCPGCRAAFTAQLGA